MPDLVLVFCAIALTLSHVTPATGLPSNINPIKTFDFWDGVPRTSHLKKVVPSTDHVHFLAKGSPYSASIGELFA